MVAILFDMDGVILDGPRTASHVYEDAVTAALATFGVDPTQAQRQQLGQHDPAAVRAACHKLGIDPDRFWARKDGYASAGTHDRIRTEDRPVYDDVDTIATLARSHSTGLVTNNRHETALFVADYVTREFGGRFDVVRGRDPTFEGFRRIKPDPYYIDDALDELGVDDGLYVGDRRSDVTAGRAAGLETAFLRRPHNRDVECPADATYELQSLSALEEIVGERG